MYRDGDDDVVRGSALREHKLLSIKREAAHRHAMYLEEAENYWRMISCWPRESGGMHSLAIRRSGSFM